MRLPGFEPGFEAWEASVLPLDYSRSAGPYCQCGMIFKTHLGWQHIPPAFMSVIVKGEDSSVIDAPGLSETCRMIQAK